MSKTELLVIIGFSIILTSIAIPNIKKYKLLRECIQNNQDKPSPLKYCRNLFYENRK